MKGFVHQAMAIDSSSPALLCPAQAVMLYWYLFCASINLTLLTVPTHIDGCAYFPVHRPGRKYALNSLMRLKTRVYGNILWVLNLIIHVGERGNLIHIHGEPVYSARNIATSL